MMDIDVTAEEGAIVSAYAAQRIKYSCHKQPLLDSVMYWRSQWMRPQPPGCKQNAYENYRLALEAWREERTNSMTTTQQPAPQKSAAHLAVEALSERIDIMAREQSKTDESIMTAIRDLQGSVGILRGLIESLSESVKHQPAQPTVPAPANGVQYTTFHADQLIMTYDDKGNPSYKAKGGRFNQYGVRVWSEVLPKLGIDPAALKPGPNPISLEVKVELETKQGDDGEPHTNAKKVVGLA